MGSAQAGPGGNPGARATHQAKARWSSIDKDESPCPTAGSQPEVGAMTMGFKPPASGLPKNIKVGDTVQFEFQAERTMASSDRLDRRALRPGGSREAAK
jgi:Cu(I)/Ag(I) efflux system membrane fusion protein